VTLDYLMTYIAWDLSLEDLKQLVLNSIEFSSVEEEHKEKVRHFFERKWKKFLAYVRGRH